MGSKSHRPKSEHETNINQNTGSSDRQFGSNSSAQDRLKASLSTSNFSGNSRGMKGPVAHALHGQIDAGWLTLEGTVAEAGIEGGLGNYKDQFGREHPSIGFNAGASLLNGGITAGSPDNNARFGAGLGLSLGFSSTITDVDNDGIPERNMDISIGPFSIGLTKEDIFSVISKDRYKELIRQADQEVYSEVGLFGGDASKKRQERLEQLVREQIQRVTNPRGL